jgi:hypothetical protein
MPVQDDVVALPDMQGIAAAFGLDAFFQGQQLAFGLQGDQGLEGGVDLESFRVCPVPVGGVGSIFGLLSFIGLSFIGCFHGMILGVWDHHAIATAGSPSTMVVDAGREKKQKATIRMKPVQDFA